MTTTADLARIFGPLLIIMGLWSFFYRKDVKKMVQSLKTGTPFSYLGAVVNLIVGLTIVNLVPWTRDFTFLMPLFGWLLIARALVIFFLPNVLPKIANLHAHVITGIISFVWGVLLCWIGWM